MVDKEKIFLAGSAESYSFLSSSGQNLGFTWDAPVFRYKTAHPSLICSEGGCLVVLAPEVKDWMQKGFLEMVESLKPYFPVTCATLSSPLPLPFS